MTDDRPKYQVTEPLLQIQGHAPFASQHQTFDRTLRNGDFVPQWVPTDELTRLLTGGFVEEVTTR